MLLTIQIILSILLIITVLLQVRGSGLGSMFGNIGGEMYRSKRGIEKLLYRGTIIVSILFVANCIALAYLYAS
ncbi:preprotein translocase subunit SecG [Patescibacteria group bacterium]|nr:preprotein translocase subunit SecG [Patescibacteria group bacterium]